MEKHQAKPGMKVRITKYDQSEKRGWAPSQASRHVGLVCEVVDIHNEHPAIHILIKDPVLGEPQWWWYHAGDLEPVSTEKSKEYKKEVNFDPTNLVMGV